MNRSEKIVWAMDRLIAARSYRQHAHFARQTRLPGWRIYFKSGMRKAIQNWRSYANAARNTP